MWSTLIGRALENVSWKCILSSLTIIYLQQMLYITGQNFKHLYGEKKNISKRFPFCVRCILCFYIVYLISWNSHVCLCFCLSVCLSLSGRGSQTMRTTVMKLLEVTQWVWGKVSDWMPSLKNFSKGNFGAKSPLMPGIIASIISTCSVNLSFMSPATYQ